MHSAIIRAVKPAARERGAARRLLAEFTGTGLLVAVVVGVGHRGHPADHRWRAAAAGQLDW